MEDARKTGIHSLDRFVRTLKQDLSAVESAVSESWSNGPVEGHIKPTQNAEATNVWACRYRTAPRSPTARAVTHGSVGAAPKLRQSRFKYSATAAERLLVGQSPPGPGLVTRSNRLLPSRSETARTVARRTGISCGWSRLYRPPAPRYHCSAGDELGGGSAKAPDCRKTASR
jgi:hypothetical protein